MNSFPHLFEPITIGSMKVPNRICHVPTDVSSSHRDGSVSERDIAHHAAIARGGTGLVIVGAASPNGSTNRSTVTNLVADEDTYIPGLARLAEGMHRYGAKCAIQLQHAGRQASLPRDGKLASNDQAINFAWSQSHAIVYANADEKKKTVHVLSTDEVIGIVEEFSEAAWRVMQAGFDAVELHAAHGYLLSQFMSPLLNRRNDRFGGSFENRMRFPLAIIGAIRQKCGAGFPILVRFSADEWVPGGRELPESLEVAKSFERAGVGALDISQCVQESPGAGFDPMQYPRRLVDIHRGEHKKGCRHPRDHEPLPSQSRVLRSYPGRRQDRHGGSLPPAPRRPLLAGKGADGKGEGHPAMHLLPHRLLAGIHDGEEGNILCHQPPPAETATSRRCAPQRKR